jgi:hypothetical protein
MQFRKTMFLHLNVNKLINKIIFETPFLVMNILQNKMKIICALYVCVIGLAIKHLYLQYINFKTRK